MSIAKAFCCLFKEGLPLPVWSLRANFRGSGQAQEYDNDALLTYAPIVPHKRDTKDTGRATPHYAPMGEAATQKRPRPRNNRFREGISSSATSHTDGGTRCTSDKETDKMFPGRS